MFDLNAILLAASEYVNKRIDEAVSQRYQAINQAIDYYEGKLQDLHNKIEADASAMAVHVEDLRSRIAGTAPKEGVNLQREVERLSEMFGNLGIELSDLQEQVTDLSRNRSQIDYDGKAFVSAVRTIASTVAMEQVDEAMGQHTNEYEHDEFLTDEDDLAKAVGEYMVGYEFEQAVRTAVSDLDFKVTVR